MLLLSPDQQIGVFVAVCIVGGLFVWRMECKARKKRDANMANARQIEANWKAKQKAIVAAREAEIAEANEHTAQMTRANAHKQTAVKPTKKSVKRVAPPSRRSRSRRTATRDVSPHRDNHAVGSMDTHHLYDHSPSSSVSSCSSSSSSSSSSDSGGGGGDC